MARSHLYIWQLIEVKHIEKVKGSLGLVVLCETWRVIKALILYNLPKGAFERGWNGCYNRHKEYVILDLSKAFLFKLPYEIITSLTKQQYRSRTRILDDDKMMLALTINTALSAVKKAKYNLKAQELWKMNKIKAHHYKIKPKQPTDIN